MASNLVDHASGHILVSNILIHACLSFLAFTEWWQSGGKKQLWCSFSGRVQSCKSILICFLSLEPAEEPREERTNDSKCEAPETVGYRRRIGH